FDRTGRLSPWRSAFPAARARPWAVRAPVLARAFARLASILRSLVNPLFSFGWLGLDYFFRCPRSLARFLAASRQKLPGVVRSRPGARSSDSRLPRLGARTAR